MPKSKIVAAVLFATCAAGFLVWLITKRPAPPLPVAEVPLAPTSAPTQGSAPSSTTNNPAQSQQSEQVPTVAKLGVNTSTRDLSEIDLIVGTNATLLIEDHDGRRTGRDPATNRVLQEIPHSAYFEDRIDNAVTGELGTEVSHQIQISQPMEGTYRLVLTGLQQGTYDLVVGAYSKDGSDQPPIEEKGNTTSGSQIRFELEFTSAPGDTSTLKRLPH